MEKKIGFIGCGNMGKAILGGLIASGQVLPGQIWVYTPSPDKVAALHDQFGINAAESAQEVAQIADIIFAAVKPGIMIKVLSEITSSLNKDSLVVSIAAGVTLDQLARALGHDRKIIRAMPNTPALVNAGMTSVTPNALVTPEDTADVLNIFRCFGEAEVIAEPMIHPVVGVSGSSPAYVFMFIEAMADAAVLGGMPRAQAYKFAAQAVMGSLNISASCAGVMSLPRVARETSKFWHGLGASVYAATGRKRRSVIEWCRMAVAPYPAYTSIPGRRPDKRRAIRQGSAIFTTLCTSLAFKDTPPRHNYYWILLA